MTEPITTPGERTRRELQAVEDSRDERTFREKMLVSQVRSEMNMESLSAAIADVAKSLSEHKADDKVEFIEVKAMIREDRDKVATISSSVNDGKVESRYTLTQLITGWLMLCGAIGALITFIVVYVSGPKP